MGLLAKVRRSFTTPLGRDAKLAFLREAAWCIPALLLIGFAGSLMTLGWTDDPRRLARLALVAIVAPALGEELLFRVLLLPPPATPVPGLRIAGSVALFVLWHPIQIFLFGPEWGETVLDPWFLAAVAVFGLAASRLYIATGSIWPSALLHWIVVVGWKAFLGGPSPWDGA